MTITSTKLKKQKNGLRWDLQVGDGGFFVAKIKYFFIFYVFFICCVWFEVPVCNIR